MPAVNPPDRSEGAPQQGRALLESHLHEIERRLRSLGRKAGFSPQEAEDLVSWALIKLLHNDCRILASFGGRSSFSTYLTVVLVNLVRDYRNHAWGKWRPSTAATRQGPQGILLERLWCRDGLALGEAIDRVLEEHGGPLMRQDLERLAGQIPRRAPRQQVGTEALLSIGVDGGVEEHLLAAEGHRERQRLRKALIPLLQALPDDDRRLLKLHYQEGLNMAEIASRLKKPQKELYTWRNRCLRRLRRALESAGLGPLQAENTIFHAG